MWYLILMTLAGSVLFTGYLCWDKLLGRLISQNMRRSALILVMLTYVIPWVWMKGIYRNFFVRQSQIRMMTAGEMPVNVAEIATASRGYQTPYYWYPLLVVGIWAVIAFFRLCMKCLKYRNGRNAILSIAEKCSRDNLEQVVKELRSELHIKRKFEIYEVKDVDLSFTIGVLKPVIFLQNQCKDEDLKFILKHELLHVQRGDLAVKLIMELVSCLHWFNPLVYLLQDEISSVCETACDECLTSDINEKAGLSYARVLIESTNQVKEKMAVGNTFTDEFENTKERVYKIMERKNVKAWEKIIAAGIFTVLLFVDSLTALAYPNVYHVQETTDELAGFYIEGNNDWAYGEIAIEENMQADEFLCDEEFVDEAGVVHKVNLNSSRVICIGGHNIISGQYRNHLKDKNGGCTIRVYDSTMCTKCNSIWIGDLVSTTVFVKCTH